MFGFIIAIFIIGLFFGSFFNVIIDRVPRDENFIAGRSHCDYCHHPLAWYDLIPLISFLLLKGRCRYCHTFMGWKYPIIEVTTGLSFVFVTLETISNPLSMIFVFAIVSCLIIIFYMDLFSGIIPDIILLPLFLLAIIRPFMVHLPFLPFLLSSLGAGLFFLSLFLITKKRGIGLGDVKYAFVMGFLLGFPGIIIGLYISFLTGALIALILIVIRRKSFASTIAFGPFLALGTLISLFWETSLWELLRHIIGF